MSFELVTAPGNAVASSSNLPPLFDDVKNKIAMHAECPDLINLCKAARLKSDWCDESKLKKCIFDVQEYSPMDVKGPKDQIVINHNLSIDKAIEQYIEDFNIVLG